MNLANRRRPRDVDRGGGSSTTRAPTIVHNFHREREGSVGRDLIFPLTNRILERERFEGLEEFLSLSLSLFLRFVRALDSVRTANEGGEEREGGVVVSIQMRKFRIYTARQAIISGARNVRVVFFAELLSRSNGSWSVKRSLLDRCYLGFNTESRTGPR